MGCPDCDFSVISDDGALVCALHDEQVHGDGMCECWQSETRRMDGDERDEVIAWPARRRRSRRS